MADLLSAGRRISGVEFGRLSARKGSPSHRNRQLSHRTAQESAAFGGEPKIYADSVRNMHAWELFC